MLELEFTLPLDGLLLDLHVQVKRGITVLFGPSGAGKSMTLQCVAGLVRPDSGRIALGNRVLYDSQIGVNLSPQGRRVGYVPQDYALFPHLNVAKNIAFGLRGLSRRQMESVVDEMLLLMELDGLGGRNPSHLSGGQQQRVALARALAPRPEILLLDEPFAALDAPVRAELRQALKDLQQRFKIPTLLVTHDLSEASFCGDQIVVMDEGRVRQIGSSKQVLMYPADLCVANIVGVKNVLVGNVMKTTVEGLVIQAGEIVLQTQPYPFDVGERVYLCVRPERVMLTLQDRQGGTRPNQIHGRIIGETSDDLNCTLFFEPESELEFSGGISNLFVDLPVYVYERLNLSIQREWTVSIPPGSIHVLPALEL